MSRLVQFFQRTWLNVCLRKCRRKWHKSSSSSSIGCGVGDHKVYPCMTIISKCDNLLFLHRSFIIPKPFLYICKVWGTLSTRSPFANVWDVQSISSSRLFLWQSEDVTKRFPLAVPNLVNQRHSVSHGIDGSVRNMFNVINTKRKKEKTKKETKQNNGGAVCPLDTGTVAIYVRSFKEERHPNQILSCLVRYLKKK